jgi:hypothetical protein
MRRVALLLVAAAALTGVIVSTASGSRHPDESAAAPASLTEMPQGYRDWKLISVSRLTAGGAGGPTSQPSASMAGGGSQLRAELGNDVAIQAYRASKLPFPDGSIVAAIHWAETSSVSNDEVLAAGFPGAGIRSFVPGPVVNMQFMVKDSKRYAATGGWGFGDFKDGKPGSAALMKTCFPCHEPAKDRDFVFTRYAP